MSRGARPIPFVLCLLTLWAANVHSAPNAGDEISPVSLSLEQKVGQLFMIAIDTEIAARYEAHIRSGKLGGALLRWDRFSGE